MHRSLRVLLGLVLAAAMLPLFSPPAGALAPPPTLIGPAAGTTVATNPMFTWSAAAGASRYRIQVASDASFSTIVFSADTVNIAAASTADLPNGFLYWRVASYDAANALGSFSPDIRFTKAAGAPSAIQPLSSQPAIDYPNTPVAFSWTPVPNTSYYIIEIDDDINFTLPLAGGTDNTVNPRYTWSTPNQMNKTLYWHVKAVSPQIISSPFSITQSFSVGWTYTAQLVYPANTTATPIEEVRFDWNGGPDPANPGIPFKTVPGATLYDLQISSDISFNTIVHQAFDLRATAYTPSLTLPASDYYWKVRAKNAVGAVGAYSATSVFRRVWPTTPLPPDGPDGNDNVTLVYPPDNGVVIEPNLAWTPSRLASTYQLWVSTDLNFSPGTVSICTTNHTNVTPYIPGCQIFFAIGTTYYWKVKPIDQPTNIQGVFSNRRQFIYNPQQAPPPATNVGPINYLSPANGFTFGPTAAPVLTWSPVNTAAPTPITNPETTPISDQTGFGRYLVQVFKGGLPFGDYYTYNTSIVPPLNFDVGPGPTFAQLPTTYTWKVILVNSVGQLGLNPGSTRSFTISPQTSSPGLVITSPAGVSGVNPPLLTWNPVTSAVRYNVYYGVRNTGIFNSTPLNQGAYTITMPGFAPESDSLLTTRDWDFFVQAYNNVGAVISTSSTSWFQINEIPTTNLTSPANCTENPTCAVQPDTPTFDWDPVVGATRYLVTVATDAGFTNVLPQYSSDTPYTKLRLAQSLADNQAGSNSYYWYARPCIGARCAPGPETFAVIPPLPSCYRVPNLVPGTPCSPVRSFTKKSHQIQMKSPAPPAYGPGNPIPGATDEITFHWDDYLKTNRTTLPLADQEAAYYQVQVATTSTFQPGTILDTQNLDATTYTDLALYPDGPLYWRVQARDGSDNLLPAPVAPGQISKLSPIIAPTAPLPGALVTGVPLFSWPAQPYAYDYSVEIYKNPDLGPQPGNLINVGPSQTVTPAFAPRQGMPAGTYGWRVKYRDASFNDSRWSTDPSVGGLRRFTLTPSGISLTSPPDGALIAPNRALFTWSPSSAPFAYYRFELSDSLNFTNILDAQNTVTNGYAPFNNYANGTYFWRVWTADGNNNLLAVSAPPRTIIIGQPGVTYKPITPTRLLDSRLSGPPWFQTRLFAGTPRDLQISGGIVPGTATAIIANVTATGSDSNSFLTVYPADQGTPNASNLNFAQGQTIPNLVTVKLSAAGAIKIATAVGSTDVIVDVVGYFDDGTVTNDFFTGIAPARILDSRLTNSPWAGQKLLGGVDRTLQVSGSQGIPIEATAAVMNVTVTGSSQSAFLTVYAGPGNRPTSSNLNFAGGQTIPNLVVTPLNSTGQASFFMSGTGVTDVIVDVVGYFGPGGDRFHVMSPTRILDSRLNTQDPLNAAWNFSPLSSVPANGRALQVSGVANVPTAATSVVMNTTVTGGTQNSVVTVFPDGAPMPVASNLNFAAGQTIPNLVMVKLGANSVPFPTAQGKVRIANNQGSVDIIADVVGYFAAQ